MTDRDPIADILGRIDRPVTPSAAFARDLRDQLRAELASKRDAEGDYSTMTTMTSLPVAGRAFAAPVPLRPPKGRWLPRLEAAAAILLLFGLFAALGGAEQFRDRFAGLVSREHPSTSESLGPASMYGGDAGRTGQQPGPEPAYEFVNSWQLGVDGTYNAGFAPVGLGETVYRVFDLSPATDPNGRSTRYLQAVNVLTGTVRWQEAIDVWGSPAVTPDYVFVNVLPDRTATPAADAASEVSLSARLIALDARTGALIWSLATGATAGWMGDVSPIVIDDTVYTAVPNGTVYAVDGRTGDVRWISTEAASSVPGGESAAGPPPISGSGQIAAGDGALYVVNTGGHLVALDLGTGARRWDIDVRQRFGILPESVDPIAVGGIVVLKIRGFDQPAEGATVGAAEDIIAAVDGATGQDLWRRKLDAMSDDIAVAGDRVIVPMIGNDAGSVMAIDLQSAADVWTLSETSGSPTGVSVAGATIFLSGGDGKLVAVDAASGREKWSIPTQTKIQFAAVVTQEHLIVEGFDGVLRSYSTDLAATPPVGPAPNKATPEATVENATAVAAQPSATPAP
jgi:outer membrane protein assembly factor BamB